MNALLNKWKDAVLDLRVWILFILLQLPVVRSFNKYVPANVYSFVFFYLTTLFIFYASVLHFGLLHRIGMRLLNNGWATFTPFILVTLISYFVYPIADGMKAQMRGSDHDDDSMDDTKDIITKYPFISWQTAPDTWVFFGHYKRNCYLYK